MGKKKKLCAKGLYFVFRRCRLQFRNCISGFSYNEKETALGTIAAIQNVTFLQTLFFFFFPSLQEVHMPKAENWWLNDRNSEHSIIGHSKAQARIKLHSPSVQGMLAGIARQNNLFHSELLMWSYQWLSAVFATLTVRSGSSCLFTYLKISKVPITTIEIQTSANIKLPTRIAGVGYSFW